MNQSTARHDVVTSLSNVLSLPASLGRLATGKSQIEVCVVVQAVAGAERREAPQVRALQERVAREAIAVAQGDDLPAKGRVCRQRRRRARGQRRRGGRAAHPAAATANDGVQSPGMQAQWPGYTGRVYMLSQGFLFPARARTDRVARAACPGRADATRCRGCSEVAWSRARPANREGGTAARHRLLQRTTRCKHRSARRTAASSPMRWRVRARAEGGCQSRRRTRLVLPHASVVI